MAKSMMDENVIHPLMPALNSILGFEDRFAEAALIRFWRVHGAEMGQAMNDPILVIGVCEVLEAV